MLKRRFRLPSPALVISMVTLSLVLGGTAVAAATAKHKDAKADTKLVKKLAPSLSVKHATTADNATNAANVRVRVRPCAREAAGAAAKLRWGVAERMTAAWHSSAAVGQRGCLLRVESGC